MTEGKETGVPPSLERSKDEESNSTPESIKPMVEAAIQKWRSGNTLQDWELIQEARDELEQYIVIDSSALFFHSVATIQLSHISPLGVDKEFIITYTNLFSATANLLRDSTVNKKQLLKSLVEILDYLRHEKQIFFFIFRKAKEILQNHPDPNSDEISQRETDALFNLISVYANSPSSNFDLKPSKV